MRVFCFDTLGLGLVLLTFEYDWRPGETLPGTLLCWQLHLHLLQHHVWPKNEVILLFSSSSCGDQPTRRQPIPLRSAVFPATRSDTSLRPLTSQTSVQATKPPYSAF